MRRLWLDCDGVLADFNTYFEQSFGHPPRSFEEQHGSNAFWRNIREVEDFYYNLPLMPDAMLLFETVKHLNPIILTGLPRNGVWAAQQKLRWKDKHFPDTEMICCLSKDKREHMNAGDVLVDDWPKYAHLWEEYGGIFILHTSAVDSISKLEAIGML